MKRIIALPILTALLMWSAVGAATNDLTGDWNGTLEVGAIKLRVVFTISKGDGGKLTAKMDSIDQGARDIPVDSVTVTGKVLRLEVNRVQGRFEGTLDTANRKAVGTWTQASQSLPLTLEKGNANAAANVEKLSPADLVANQQAALKVAGTWNGALDTGVESLRLRVNITKTPDAGATGTMDSLDQNANGIPLSALTLKDGRLRFEARGVGGVYQGTLAADGATLKGDWQQGGQNMPLDLTKAASK